MEIRNVTCNVAQIPLTKVSELARARYESVTFVVVRIELNGGIVGFGDITLPGPSLTQDTFETIKMVVERYYSPSLVGKNVYHVESLIQQLDKIRTGHIFAKALLDIALHDAIGKSLGVPLVNLWGGPLRESIDLVGWVGVSSIDKTVAEASEFADQGFKTLKLKLGTNIRDDVERVKQVRKQVGDNTKIRVDVNQMYSPSDCLRLIRQIVDYDIELFEDPVAEQHWTQLRDIKMKSPVPICADTMIRSPADAARVLAAEAADFIKIKIARVGGFLRARKILAVAEAFGIPVIIGRGTTSDLEAVAEVHLALSSKAVYGAGEMVGFSKLTSHIVENPLEIRGGKCFLPKEPGLGLKVVEERYKKFAYDGSPFAVGFKG